MTDELRELLISAKSKEEIKAILSAHRDDLSDAELNEIAGGYVGTTFASIIKPQ